MTARLPSLNGLRAFEAAARHLSFTLAASELNVTQTAISHQIRRLEEELGIRLFIRKNRALALTPPTVGDALSVGGTAQDWIDKIERDFRPSGFNHLLVTFADAFLVESWSGLTIEGLPSLDDQIRLFHDSVMGCHAG